LFVIILALRIQADFVEKKLVWKPIYDYLILAAILLTCIFIGYLQFQYTTFGTHYGLATLIPTIGLFCAYYFDNKKYPIYRNYWSCGYIGLSVSPQSLINNDFHETATLSYSAIGLELILILWSNYSIKQLKTLYLSLFDFCFHLISISCINNLCLTEINEKNEKAY
jgi:hypothetical protein